MTTIYNFKNGYKLIIQDSDCPFNSLMDYDEFAGKSIIGNTRNSTFGSRSNYFERMNDVLEEPYDFTTDGFSSAETHWEKLVKELEGIKTIPKFDFKPVIDHVWKEIWKPVIDSHIEYVKQADDADLIEMFDNLDRTYTIERFKIFKHKGLSNRIGSQDLYDLPEGELESLKTDYCESINNLNPTTMVELDEALDIFILGYFDLTNFEYRFMVPDPDLDNRIRNSIIYAYVKGNPYIQPVLIFEAYHNYRVKIVSEIESANYLIISDEEDEGKSVIVSLEEYFKDEWYSGKVVYSVSDADKFKYVDQTMYGFDEVLQENVVDLNDSCCGFTSEQDVIEHFDYYQGENVAPPTFKLNYKKLGTTQAV